MEYDAVDFKLVKSFGIFIVLGVIGGTFLAVNLKTSTFVLFFSVMAFIVGLFFILIVGIQIVIGGLNDYGVLSINQNFQKFF